ncbi:ABC transporter, permease/ATP-binding protein [Spongiibacter sp. IMCC21906]|uniref:ABC transporter transmembrane domain-containing protein n=1 Tax=Spongiibacter sp. IMCC21906 TaxID=1620392 RepID=UPI00062DF2F4|nr:ABC transporter transmembrane domain-containing protein [Spongiibacter sp. IMCC21906]AKH68960.1 ABC transporter, permease/ATP-binding protein [Spongiibacter sp. IMCC21906]
MAEQQREREKSSNIRVLSAMLGFIKPYRWQAVLASIALICTAGITLSIGQGLRLLIDQGFAEGADPKALNDALLLFMFMVLLLAAGTFTRFYFVSWIGERVSADLRKAVFNHMITLHPGFFETNVSGEIQSRITTDTSLLQTVIGSSVSIALRNFLMFLGGLVLLFVTNPKLTGMVLLSVPLVVAPILIFGRRVRRLSRDSQDKIASVGSFVGEAIKNIKLLQAFNHQAADRQRFDDYVESAFQVAEGRIRQRAWLSTAVIVLVLGAVSAMMWVGGHDVLAGRISGGELAAFIFYAVMVAASVGAISEVFGDLQRAAGASERLLELLAAKSLVTAPIVPEALPADLGGRLELQQIFFHYPSRPDGWAINGVSLNIAAGSSLALVGSSGAGKSTMIDLLLRFYDVQQGAILFEGVDIRKLAPDDLRSHIAMVPQQPVLFTGSVGDNIRYGKPSASDEEVEAAAKAAYADDFIRTLPKGYDSYVGEGGIRLSGGQRQRIAIARAVLADPRLLLLDEATSALDAESEYQVQKALETLMKGRTTIVIAHRLATVVNVDTIAVLDHGQVVATGSHAELLQRSELYARWASLQFDEGQVGLGSQDLSAPEVQPTENAQ